MELLEALLTRRSVRKYRNQPIPSELVEKILEVAIQAPTSCNRQLWYFVVVNRETFNAKLLQACDTIAAINPPLVLFILYDRRYNREHAANAQSAAAAAMHTCLYAHSLGLGTLWMAGYGDEKAIKRILNIPDEYMIAGCVVLGYPDQRESAPARRPLKDVVSYNQFGHQKPFPFSWRPKDWTPTQLQEMVQYCIRAKSPTDRFYKPSLREFKLEMELIPHLSGKTLLFAPFSGNHLFQLLCDNKLEEVSAAVWAEEVARFLKEKATNLGIQKNIEFIILNHQIPYPDKAVDNLLCIYQLERMQDPVAITREFHRVLKPSGKLILFLANRSSIYYTLWMMKQSLCSWLDRKLDYSLFIPSASMALRGPFEPLTSAQITRSLENFEVVDVQGILTQGTKKHAQLRPSSFRRLLTGSLCKAYRWIALRK